MENLSRSTKVRFDVEEKTYQKTMTRLKSFEISPYLILSCVCESKWKRLTLEEKRGVRRFVVCKYFQIYIRWHFAIDLWRFAVCLEIRKCLQSTLCTQRQHLAAKCSASRWLTMPMQSLMKNRNIFQKRMTVNTLSIDRIVRLGENTVYSNQKTIASTSGITKSKDLSCSIYCWNYWSN